MDLNRVYQALNILDIWYRAYDKYGIQFKTIGLIQHDRHLNNNKTWDNTQSVSHYLQNNKIV